MGSDSPGFSPLDSHKIATVIEAVLRDRGIDEDDLCQRLSGHIFRGPGGRRSPALTVDRQTLETIRAGIHIDQKRLHYIAEAIRKEFGIEIENNTSPNLAPITLMAKRLPRRFLIALSLIVGLSLAYFMSDPKIQTEAQGLATVVGGLMIFFVIIEGFRLKKH